MKICFDLIILWAITELNYNFSKILNKIIFEAYLLVYNHKNFIKLTKTLALSCRNSSLAPHLQTLWLSSTFPSSEVTNVVQLSPGPNILHHLSCSAAIDPASTWPTFPPSPAIYCSALKNLSHRNLLLHFLFLFRAQSDSKASCKVLKDAMAQL